MENPDLRVSMGMGSDQKGVRIKRIEPTAPESHLLKPSDVILSFDGVNIANDGTGEPYFLSKLRCLQFHPPISKSLIHLVHVWQL